MRMAMKIPSQKINTSGLKCHIPLPILSPLLLHVFPSTPINYYTTIRWVSGKGPILQYKLQEILDPPDVASRRQTIICSSDDSRSLHTPDGMDY
jgi:hypothetical protein